MSKVSVIIVSYNTADKLRRCLSCIEPEHEVIVVDNASADGSPLMVQAEFPSAQLISNRENRGFGAANNQGIEASSGELLLFLNSDAYAEPGAIRRLAAALEDPAVIAAGGMLLNPDGSLQQSVAAHLTLWMVFLEQTMLEKLLRPFGLGYWRTKQALAHPAQPVSQVMGACLMARRSPETRFDERFFLYCEDTDLCRRMGRLGNILYVPDARFTHELGSSSSKAPWLGVKRYNRGKELYFRIHHGQIAERICKVLDGLGAVLRLILWLPLSFTGKGSAKVELFWRVVSSPLP